MLIGFGEILSPYRFRCARKKDEDIAACQYIADGLAGRYDSRLRHSKEAAKLIRGMYVTM